MEMFTELTFFYTKLLWNTAVKWLFSGCSR